MDPRAAQPCGYCHRQATQSLVWAEGYAYIPVCPAHDTAARNTIRESGGSVIDVRKCSDLPLGYHEAKMARALQPAPTAREPHEESSYGLRCDPLRRASLTQAAPTLRFTPVLREQPVRYRMTDKPVQEAQKVAGEEIPTSLLRMLGTNWKRLKAFRVHDNRVALNIDGTPYTVYTRKG
jgi:hypothetical protein